MLPCIVLHNAVGLDGRIDWFSPDIAQFYGLIPRWKEGATLAVGLQVKAAAGRASADEHSTPLPFYLP